MPKKKNKRIKDVRFFENVTHSPEQYRGRWHSAVFQNRAPITLELGCGKGEYTTTHADAFPQRNFIGLDLKAARIWVGASTAGQAHLGNAFFIVGHALDLHRMFAKGEVKEIWIPFPDPFHKKPRKRLLSPRYLHVYRSILASDARLHFKTDDSRLYHYATAAIPRAEGWIHQATDDLYASRIEDDRVKLSTDYENRHRALGKRIKYICFSLPDHDWFRHDMRRATWENAFFL